MTANLEDAGKLIAWAHRPKESPRRNADYRDLVQRYLDDGSFAAAARSIAGGMGLNLHVDPDVGVVATAYKESPLRIPMPVFKNKAVRKQSPALIGMTLLGIARCAYPDPLDIEDHSRVPRVSVVAVSDYLTRVAEEKRNSAVDPEDNAGALSVPWRVWLSMRETRASGSGSVSDRHGLVRKVCAFLADEGLLTHVSDDDGGTYRATARLRVAVDDVTANSDLFALLIAADDLSIPVQGIAGQTTGSHVEEEAKDLPSDEEEA